MATRNQASDDIAAQLKKQQNMYDNPDPDGSDDVTDIDEEIKKFTGDTPDADSESDFVSNQIDSDDKKRGDVAPDGSDAQEDEE